MPISSGYRFPLSYLAAFILYRSDIHDTIFI